MKGENHMSTNWWGERKSVSQRLIVEARLMKESFGSTFKMIVPATDDGRLVWEGVVEINFEGLKRTDHRIRIECPHDYPERPPDVRLVDPAISTGMHQYSANVLCLFNPSEGENHGWNPSRSTCVTAASWGAQWLYAYYTWKKTGEWPGDEHSVQRLVSERDRMLEDDFPRGSIRRYRR
jgi:ubiquitin-protein ligase